MSDGGISLETIQQESSVKYYICLCWYYLLIAEFFLSTSTSVLFLVLSERRKAHGTNTLLCASCKGGYIKTNNSGLCIRIYPTPHRVCLDDAICSIHRKIISL